VEARQTVSVSGRVVHCCSDSAIAIEVNRVSVLAVGFPSDSVDANFRGIGYSCCHCVVRMVSLVRQVKSCMSLSSSFWRNTPLDM